MLELQTIEDALRKNFGKKSIAAGFLGLSADQLRYKVLKFFNANPGIVRKDPSICSSYKFEC